MRQKSNSTPVTSEKLVRDIRRATRKQYSAEEKIRIILDGLRGETPIPELCRREGIAESMYYSWSKEFLEAGKRRLAGDTTRAATTDEVKQLRREAQDLKEVGRAGPRGELLRSLLAAALVATSLSPLARSPASADQYAARDGFDSQTVNPRCPLGDSEMAAGASWLVSAHHGASLDSLMAAWLRHDKTDGPANEPNQRPDQNRNSYPGEVRPMGQHAG